MKYKYEAMDSSGRVVSDVVDANSEGEAQTLVRRKGLFMTKVVPLTQPDLTMAPEDLDPMPKEKASLCPAAFLFAIFLCIGGT